MKYISIAALTLFGALTGSGQMLCHDESVCTPMGGCRWVAVCRATPAPAPLPMPTVPMPTIPMPAPAPGPLQCHDESICTPMGGCRWVTVCK